MEQTPYLINEYPILYGIQMSITLFTRAHQYLQSCKTINDIIYEIQFRFYH
jgi:hypothetical protein